MKKILLSTIGAVLFITLAVFLIYVRVPAQTIASQSPVFVLSSSVQTPFVMNIIGSGTQFVQLAWNVQGTISACTIRVDSSSDGITWNNGDIISNQTCTSGGNVVSTAHTVNFIRVNPNSTITGTGNLTIVVTGYANNTSLGNITVAGNNITLTPNGFTTVSDYNGQVFVDGTRFTNLCDALKYAGANATRRSVVSDFNAYEAWTKDPFNDATCGNAAVTGLSSTVYLGNGNFINGTGGTVHIPNTVDLRFNGRAAESQISTTNGCGTATPTGCQGTLLIAFSTAAPFTGGNAMTCVGCVAFPVSTVMIDFATNGAFGTVLQGPGTISCAGVSGSIGVQNQFAQEQSYLINMAVVGCEGIGVDWETSTAQNSYFWGIEVLSGNLTGNSIATPSTYICYKINSLAPNRMFGNSTCNPRGTATVTPITTAVLILNSRGVTATAFHIENANNWFVVDGSAGTVILGDNSAGASADASTPVAGVVICSSTIAGVCTSGNPSTNTFVSGLVRISPNLTTNAIVDNNNSASDGTIPFTTWDGMYIQYNSTAGAFKWSKVIYDTAPAAGAASITATTMATSGTGANSYLFSGYLSQTGLGVTCTTNTTAVLNLIWTDPSSAGQTTTALATLTIVNNGATGTNQLVASNMVRAKASTTVQFSLTYTAGTCATPPNVRVFPVLTKLN